MNFQSTIYVENSNNINFIHYATIMLGAKILDKIFDPPKILKKKKKRDIHLLFERFSGLQLQLT